MAKARRESGTSGELYLLEPAEKHSMNLSLEWAKSKTPYMEASIEPECTTTSHNIHQQYIVDVRLLHASYLIKTWRIEQGEFGKKLPAGGLQQHLTKFLNTSNGKLFKLPR